jgi:hypothetical protein
MAFQLSEQVTSGQVQVSVLQNDSEYIARILIGSDDESGAVFSAVVVLTSNPTLPAGTLELMFGIVETSHDVDGEIWISDGAETQGFLKGADRKAVLDCICTMALELAKVAQPDVITFVTAVSYLPDKALTKYGIICKALRDAGYRGGKGDTYLGSEIWMLTRRPEET